MDRIDARLRDRKTGDPLDPGTHIGALTDAEHFKKVRDFLDDSDMDDGPYVKPVIYQVTRDDYKATDEIFGPVLSMIEVASNDEAVAVANRTAYGIAASVFTANIRHAIRAAHDIRAGTVTVNCHGRGNIATPFGGYKHSGGRAARQRHPRP